MTGVVCFALASLVASAACDRLGSPAPIEQARIVTAGSIDGFATEVELFQSAQLVASRGDAPTPSTRAFLLEYLYLLVGDTSSLAVGWPVLLVVLTQFGWAGSDRRRTVLLATLLILLVAAVWERAATPTPLLEPWGSPSLAVIAPAFLLVGTRFRAWAVLPIVVLGTAFTLPVVLASVEGRPISTPPVLVDELTRFGRNPMPGVGFRTIEWGDDVLVVPERVEERPGPRFVLSPGTKTVLWLVSPDRPTAVAVLLTTRAGAIDVGLTTTVDAHELRLGAGTQHRVRLATTPHNRNLGRLFPRRETFTRVEVEVGTSHGRAHPVVLGFEKIESERRR